MLDEFADAAAESEFGSFVAALVGQRNFQAFVEEGEFAQTLGQRVVAIGGLVENRRIGVESDFCAGFAGLVVLLQLRRGLPPFVGLLPDRANTRNLEPETIGKRV